ncbi:MAG: putative sulfate exporter family transporter [Alistipes sp.]|nr:putative sulfate exporter family transporter [Alistipes sp.]
MKNLLEKLRTEDWVVVWMSIPLLLLAIFIPKELPSVPATLIGSVAWYNIALLFLICLAVLYVGTLLLRRPMKGLLPSFVVVFAISLLAQVVAKIPQVSYYGFESVFFSVVFGLLIRNLWHVPEWMKPAVQGEFYIKIGVVCLGATILFSDVMKSGVFGLVQAILVVAIVWFFAFWLSRRMKVDERTAMILSSGVSICGVSACITAARVAGGDDKKLSYIVSLVLIVVVPMIYLMPWLARTVLPMIFDDPQTLQEVAGAWIGGTIDTTSGVAASSTIVGEVANQHAVIIKAAQNVLIGVVAFFIALYLSARGGQGGSGRPSLGIVWEKFPKFILGFVAASLVLRVCQSGGAFIPEKGKLVEPGVAKMFSTVFFSLAFVCIGLDTRLKDIISKENRNALWAFLGAQVFNIVVTLVVACLLFGVLKPMF